MERHSAYKAQGKPTYTTRGLPRELDILKLLARYDLLHSNFICHALDNYQATRKALTALCRGQYIGFPEFEEPDEKLALIPRNHFYVYELKPRGKRLLRSHDVGLKVGGNDHFKHRLLRSEIEFLLDRNPLLSVVGPEDILNHALCPVSTRNAARPFVIPPKPHLNPDITRGFGHEGNFLFLHIEVDRGNEPILSLNARQSLKSKVERYRKYFEQGDYKKHFGFAVAPSALFITTRENTATLHNVITDFAGKWAKRFFYTTIPAKPLPTFDLFAPWQGVNGAFDLMETLHVRRDEGRARERAGENHQGR